METAKNLNEFFRPNTPLDDELLILLSLTGRRFNRQLTSGEMCGMGSDHDLVLAHYLKNFEPTEDNTREDRVKPFFSLLSMMAQDPDVIAAVESINRDTHPDADHGFCDLMRELREYPVHKAIPPVLTNFLKSLPTTSKQSLTYRIFHNVWIAGYDLRPPRPEPTEGKVPPVVPAPRGS